MSAGEVVYYYQSKFCKIKGCNDYCLDGFNYCLFHKCNYISCPKVIYKSRYCEDHKCKASNCERKRDILVNCKLHGSFIKTPSKKNCSIVCKHSHIKLLDYCLEHATQYGISPLDY